MSAGAACRAVLPVTERYAVAALVAVTKVPAHSLAMRGPELSVGVGIPVTYIDAERGQY